MDNTGRHAKTVLSVMLIMFLGKFAGLMRDILFGYRYGTGSVEAEAFGYAAQFPSTFLDVFVASALTASFIPVFSGIMAKKGKDAAFRMANTFITLIFTVTAAFTIALIFAAPLIIRLFLTFSDGGAFADEVLDLAAPLLRIMLPTIVLTGAAFSVTGILQAMEEFNAPAAMSLVSNLLIIAYLLFFVNTFGIFGLAVTFLIGWGTQILIQLPALRKKGFRFKPALKLREPDIKAGLKDIGKLMLPVMVGAWAFPINLLVNMIVAGRVTGVAAIRYANTIYAVITGILVLSVTNVMFTRFSKLNADHKNEELGESITLTSRTVLFFLLPLSAAIFALSPSLTYIIYERGEFTAHSTYITGTALRFFSLGMAGFGLYNILSRGCYAVRDGRTPLLASLAAIVVNAALSVLLVDSMGTGGPALASSVSITVAGVILLVSLTRKKIFRAKRCQYADLLKILFLSVTMGLIVFAVNGYFTGTFDESKLSAALSAVLAGLAGLIWYALGAWLLRVREVEVIKGMFKGKEEVKPENKGLNVLMVTMSLNIGGAETHIIELCRGLKKAGVNVFVASAGGKYVTELTEYGIPHFFAPLSRKRPQSILTSYSTLKRVIRENDIRIVHAHARIPAFICGFLCRRLRTRFVTTAHGLYKTGFPYTFLTNWGQATLAVSEDVKEYLVNEYNCDKERVILTINGIDSDKFKPETDGTPLLGELGLDPKKKRIVSVCRLDSHIDPDNPSKTRGGALLAALCLCEAAPSLEKERPGEFEIIIVGDGDSYEQVENAAKKANKAVGREMVVLTGARTDVNTFLGANFAFLFVNTGRSAFEAMSSACPVILADSDGFMGLLTPDKYEKAKLSNFCCRGGYPNPSAEMLLHDILAAADMEPARLAEIGAYGRDYVKKGYSVEQMASDAILLYGLVSRKIKKYDAVLSGYYGTGNSGDEMILMAIIKSISKEVAGARIAVLCRRKPRETAARLKLKTAFAFNIPAIYRLLRQTNLFISGGGTLITDITSTKSLMYYLFVIRLANLCGCKTMIYASGIGPFKNSKNRRRAEKTLREVDLITLRDEISLEETGKMDIRGKLPVVTADAVFGLPAETVPAEPLLHEFKLEGVRFFIVAIRSWKALPDDFTDSLARFADYMHKNHGLTALYLPMMLSEDLAISRRVLTASKVGGILIERNLEIGEVLSLAGMAEFAAAMRLHAVIYAAKMGTPVIGLSYDPKVNGILEIFRSEHYVNVENVTAEKLIGFAEDVLKNREEISARLVKVSGELAQKSQVTVKLAGEIIRERAYEI